ncbi:hypothetical protein [Sphingobium sp. D43FB]|uniref:hypothetical protein n=1 Tax=Sphingobium sp. D43FB TaxID=2017595 RepID=UPI000BCB4B0E|nr:hypothetical protein [Sphingobium sp. D43FB]PBN41451.1 hypothetical protein SxD43FB_21705 [Sphingobium sp. D43FB]
MWPTIPDHSPHHFIAPWAAAISRQPADAASGQIPLAPDPLLSLNLIHRQNLPFRPRRVVLDMIADPHTVNSSWFEPDIAKTEYREGKDYLD